MFFLIIFHSELHIYNFFKREIHFILFMIYFYNCGEFASLFRLSASLSVGLSASAGFATAMICPPAAEMTCTPPSGELLSILTETSVAVVGQFMIFNWLRGWWLGEDLLWFEGSNSSWPLCTAVVEIRLGAKEVKLLNFIDSGRSRSFSNELGYMEKEIN